MRVDHLRRGVVRLRRPAADGPPPVTTFAVLDEPGETPPGSAEVEVRVEDEGAAFTAVRADGSPLVEGATVAAAPGVHGDAHTLRWRPAEDERLYGWGEWALPPEKRGRRLVSWNTDAFNFGPGEDSLYGTYPLLVCLRDGQAHGLFWNDPHRTTLDLTGSEAVLESDGGAFDLVVLAGPTPADVLAQYTAVTGRPPLWPRWSLGLHQSRWGYASSDIVREVAAGYRSREIPCDVIHLDIDHMRGYRVFTFDPDAFGDGPELVRELHDQGFRVVSIADPGIKVDPDWEVPADGLAEGVFVRAADGRAPFVGPVWPGDCYFPDFTDAAARAWWVRWASRWLAESGVDGLWNDMNEPAVFDEPPVTAKEEDEPVAAIVAAGDVGTEQEDTAQTMPDDVRHRIDGVDVDHRTAHNLYGVQMARATHDAFRGTERRPFVLTRSGFAGVQRHSFVWTGDNRASWDHVRLALHMTVGLGLAGVPFCGADVGGFTKSPTPEMYVRFAQVGVLMPLMRIHCARPEPWREPWRIAEPHGSWLREAIDLRYRLLPYLYTVAEEAHRTGTPILRPLWWDHPADGRLHDAPDVALLGPSLVAAPVLDRGARTVRLPLPAGRWRDLETGLVYEGEADVDAPVDRLPLLAACGAVTPLGGSRPVLRVDLDPVDGPLVGTRYEDDGESYAYRDGGFRRVRYRGRGGPEGFTLTSEAEGALAAVGNLLLEVHGLDDAHPEVEVDGVPAAVSFTGDGVVRIAVPAGFETVVARSTAT